MKIFISLFLLSASVQAEQLAAHAARFPASESPAVVAAHEDHQTFRTPARRYGSAYSVKLTINRDGTEYVVPVWVKPDQATSSLDRELMKDLGWVYTDTKTEDVNLSGESIENTKLKNARSDWAYYPDYAKICCYGVLGQDILKNFKMKFDPQPPSHIEWERVSEETSIPTVNTSSASTKRARETFAAEGKSLNASLAQLFTLHTENVRFKGKTLDLSETPYEVDLKNRTLKIDEPRKILGADKLRIRAEPIFKFSFVPASRLVKVEKIAADVAKSAKAVGLRNSLNLTEINFMPVAQFDKYEVGAMLRGKVKTPLQFTVEFRAKTMKLDDIRRTIFFDFVKNEFTEEK